MASSDILILGSHGIVGSAIATAAGERAILAARLPVSKEVWAFDALTDDITQLLVRMKEPPKAVVIAFGIAGVHACATNLNTSRRLNIDSVVAVARAAANVGALPVIFSSDGVFDNRAKLWSEEDSPSPINEYGHQKLAAEQEVSKLGYPYLTMRLSRVIADQAGHRDLLYQWCDLIRRNAPIRLPTDQNFTPISAVDLGRIAVDLIDADVRGLIHVAGPRQLSAPDLLDLLREERIKIGLSGDFAVEPCRVADLPGVGMRLANTMLSIERLKQVISPKFQPLTETVRSVVVTDFANQSSSFS